MVISACIGVLAKAKRPSQASEPSVISTRTILLWIILILSEKALLRHFSHAAKLLLLHALDVLPTSFFLCIPTYHTHCNLSILLFSLVARDCPFICLCDTSETHGQRVNRSFTRSIDHRSL